MDPSVSGPNGTMRASALAAELYSLEIPGSVRHSSKTHHSGLLAFTITGPR